MFLLSYIGIIPAKSHKFAREQLEETVLVTQKKLEFSPVGRRLPFCAFNACQRFFDGIEGGKSLHVGDQFLSAGANDFKFKYDEAWKDEVRKNWRGWTKAATAGDLALVGYVTRDLWIPDRYREYQRRSHQSDRDSAIYETLKRGSSFSEPIRNTLPCDSLVSEAKKLVTPAEEPRGYSLIIGEHRTGKTILIQLTANSLKKPKGIMYVKVPNTDEMNTNPTIVIDAVKKALGWSSDPVLNSRNSVTEWHMQRSHIG
ncbi:hypothetical protein GP486_008256, partial [Trichoglossum hirsutum]